MYRRYVNSVKRQLLTIKYAQVRVHFIKCCEEEKCPDIIFLHYC